MLRLQSIVGGLLALGLTLGPVPASFADLVAGGGNAKSDCYVEEDVAGWTTGTNVVTCNEGTDACDTDGIPNGVCVFKVALCPNQTGVTGCTPAPPLTAITVKSKPKGTILANPTDLAGTTCGAPTDITVPIKVTKKGKQKPGKVKLLIKAKSSGKPKTDPDKLILICNPAPVATACLVPNPAGGPDEIDLQTGDSGSDLDNGWTGISQNFPVPPRSKVKLCLSGCDASTNPVCDASGDTGAGSLNGPTFGPPLPLIAQSVPVCVINRYQPGPITAKINVQTGEVDATNSLAVNLFSDVHLTLTNQVCPRCKGNGAPQFGGTGKCDGGPNVNQNCTIDSIINVPQAAGSPLYALSSGCPPDPSQLAPGSTLNIKLRLTTGTSTLTGPKPCTAQPGEPTGLVVQDDNCHGMPCNATCTGIACVSHDSLGRCIDSKGGISQVCCAGSSITPCFPTAGGGAIVRTGTADPPAPVWPDPTYPKTSTGGILVTTFCEGATGVGTINSTSGLPGPGALILPGTQILKKIATTP